MELREVVGRRRSIRIFAPYEPVERAKRMSGRGEGLIGRHYVK
jgi:hypothetical protein